MTNYLHSVEISYHLLNTFSMTTHMGAVVKSIIFIWGILAICGFKLCESYSGAYFINKPLRQKKREIVQIKDTTIKLQTPYRHKFLPESEYEYSISAMVLRAVAGPDRYTASHWIECLLTLPTSRILVRTRSTIAAHVIWSAALTWLHKRGVCSFCLPTSVPTILGSALGLLLVFRTSSSYDR